MPNSIENQKMWSTKQVVWAIGFLLTMAISITFTLTMIYSEFILHGNMISINHETCLENDLNTNRRLDIKTGRNSEAIEKQNERLTKLELPNTDE